MTWGSVIQEVQMEPTLKNERSVSDMELHDTIALNHLLCAIVQISKSAHESWRLGRASELDS